jgi:hypothetical protein
MHLPDLRLFSGPAPCIQLTWRSRIEQVGMKDGTGASCSKAGSSSSLMSALKMVMAEHPEAAKIRASVGRPRALTAQVSLYQGIVVIVRIVLRTLLITKN